MKEGKRVTIHDVLDGIRRGAGSTVEQGAGFERLMVALLRTVPYYRQLFSEVELLRDSPHREEGETDTGVDIIAKERETGDLWAIQAKFHRPDSRLTLAEISTFLATSGEARFARRMLVCTCGLSRDAAKVLARQEKRCQILKTEDLERAPVDWGTFAAFAPDALKRRERKEPRDYQKDAIEAVVKGLAEGDRGKLIMACGTGKTLTALRIAEEMVPKGGSVLFLAPSLSLISQSLQEWDAESSDEKPLRAAAVCSDSGVGKAARGQSRGGESGDFALHEVPFQSNTDKVSLANWFRRWDKERQGGVSVVYGTYQSLRVISEAQRDFPDAVPEFDLVVCDEAHRTAGTSLADREEAGFRLVHDGEAIRARKRLYMTATPKVFSPKAQARAEQREAVIYSMDDEEHFGKELHRLSFSRALKLGILCDYRVLVLTEDEGEVSDAFRDLLEDDEADMSLNDATRAVGCINGLRKRIVYGDKTIPVTRDETFMHRAVAFSNSIRSSQRFEKHLRALQEKYDDIEIEARHVDGAQSAVERSGHLEWLKAEPKAEEGAPPVCRVLTNARCLSEGVDVPALDGVIFLEPRGSQVDVVQSVGRVMRKAPGTDKKVGYIILPIGVHRDDEPERALDHNRKFKVVWQIVQALRSHDERLDILINSLALEERATPAPDPDNPKGPPPVVLPPDLPFDGKWREGIKAKIVQKFGRLGFWRIWAHDVAAIAKRHVTQIGSILGKAEGKERREFDKFHAALKKTLNQGVEESDAVEMLAQHLIMHPVFEALFEDYAFADKNPVSRAMEKMLNLLRRRGLEREQRELEGFYSDIRERLQGIRSPRARQQLLLEIYEDFFQAVFPSTAERLGIVYTPTEIVDFIIRSVNEVLKEEFDSDLAGEGVQILDPFTGTGTFMARLIQSGLIPPESLKRKYLGSGGDEYDGELHAIEMVLLAYYMAAVNIEEAYHGVVGGEYSPFQGILLADTFQMHEEGDFGDVGILPINTARAEAQKKARIRVILGNPPYSARQGSENDANRNLKYKSLDDRIASTYVKKSASPSTVTIYDSYIRAIRLATDRIDKERGGVIGFVTNASFLNSRSADGLRKCLMEEFSAIHILNLRGNARLTGEAWRREGEKVFGSGSRLPVAVLILVKKPGHEGPATLRYRDIGDYLTREQKLRLLKEWKSIGGTPGWKEITPNEEGDWLNQRNKDFLRLLPMGDPSARRNDGTEGIFINYSMGVIAAREWWSYNFSATELERNLKALVRAYEEHRVRMHKIPMENRPPMGPEIDRWVDNDPTRIKWSRGLKQNLLRGTKIIYASTSNTMSLYRPFTKRHFGYETALVEEMYQHGRFFPAPESRNLVIITSGIAAATDFSALMTDVMPSNAVNSTGQCFPLYTYERNGSELPGKGAERGFSRKDNISDSALAKFRAAFPDLDISREDIFHYIYGVLHSPEYRRRFAFDLKLMLPRIPLARDSETFRQFLRVGRELGRIHVGYDDPDVVKPYSTMLVDHRPPEGADPWAFYAVRKMRHKGTGREKDRTTIVFNDGITIGNIPEAAYRYVVNGRPAVEWVMDQYRVKTDRDSGIVQDPNLWARERGEPDYIYRLLLRVVAVAVLTDDLVSSLPPGCPFRETTDSAAPSS